MRGGRRRPVAKARRQKQREGAGCTHPSFGVEPAEKRQDDAPHELMKGCKIGSKQQESTIISSNIIIIFPGEGRGRGSSHSQRFSGWPGARPVTAPCWRPLSEVQP